MSTAAPSPAPAAPQNGTAGPQTSDTTQGVRDEKGRFQGQQEAKPAEPPKPSKLRIKDLELEEEAAYREIQRGRQSTKLMTEAQRRFEAAEAKEKAQAERGQRYKTDLSEFFKDQGFNADDAKRLASEYLYKNVIEPAEMSPEARRIRELEAKLKEKAEAEESQKKTAESAEQERMTKEQAQALEHELIEAMEGGVLPKDKSFVGLVSGEMAKFAERGVDISVAQGVKLAEEKLGRLGGKVLASADVDQLAAWLGKENFQQVALKFLSWSRTKLAGAQSQPQQRTQQPQATSAQRKKLTPQEWWEAQRKGGK